MLTHTKIGAVFVLIVVYGLLLVYPLQPVLSATRSRIPGIWQLHFDELGAALFQNSTDDMTRIRYSLQSQGPSKQKQFALGEKGTGGVLLKLNTDGTFRQCSEAYQEGCWISGRWVLKYISIDASNEKDNQASNVLLLLALDRQYYGPRNDTLLEGCVQLSASNRSSASISTTRVQGRVKVGKFTYPKKHPFFFDTPLVLSSEAGSFVMEQAVAALSVLSTTKEEPLAKLMQLQEALLGESYSKKLYQESDFYGRTFYMTVEPLPSRQAYRDENRGQESLDIRAIPLQFYANNTFQAWGINKILRGRFGITRPSEEEENQRIWLQVSLFGAGRSAPGSVYSEGIGLSHEDKRLYVGEILKSTLREAEERQRRLFVTGIVSFGSDWGSDARPEPVACFRLFETKDLSVVPSFASQATGIPSDEEEDFDPSSFKSFE